MQQAEGGGLQCEVPATGRVDVRVTLALKREGGGIARGGEAVVAEGAWQPSEA